MGRKTCPTHADQTAFPNGVQEIFFAGNDWRLYGIRNRLQSVCFNFHAFASSAIAHSEIGNCLDRSGHATVNRGSHKGIGVTDFLPDTDTVPHFDQRGTGCTDVHTHRNPNPFRQRQGLAGSVCGVFVMCQFYAAEFFSHKIASFWTEHFDQRNLLRKIGVCSCGQGWLPAVSADSKPSSNGFLLCRKFSQICINSAVVFPEFS